MWQLRSLFSLLAVLLLCSTPALVHAQGSRNRTRWQTLSGNAPLVIARGGMSGIFPDSSEFAYGLSAQTGASNMLVWCDVQLTIDGAGICFPDIRLENGSIIERLYPNRSSTYTVNGVSTRGWFASDFTLDELTPVNLVQRVLTRAPNFDDLVHILAVEEVVNLVRPPPQTPPARPPGLWLNVPHDAFYSQHNLSMRSFVIAASRRVIVNYISSPEVGFLNSLVSRFGTSVTKLVFQFLGPDEVEPTTNQTYGSLLNNLTSIRSFASGIIVPKYYIWPIASNNYLQNSTSLVLDAHRAGLEVFASGFANDGGLAYDYGYDPVAEYLSYIDNDLFSVDGVLSDFSITPSATIDCYSHMGTNDSVLLDLLVISNEGASGLYPGSTDRAYERAVTDGVDVIDCSVQMTSDGIPFCLGSINLRDRTDVAQSDFRNLTTNNPDLNIEDGIFTYSLTWSQIQSLRPAIDNPYSSNYTLFRNPRARNDGNLMQLSDFLEFANNASSVSGVFISIENAAYLAVNQGLDVTDAVLEALASAGYNNQTAKRIMITSTDSAVLSRFKNTSDYELVYRISEDVNDILNSTILEIKDFANSVVISKESVFPATRLFVTSETKLVPKLHAFNLTVFVQYFRNEFVSQPWDFFSDAYFEMHMYASYMGVDGVITDYPATADKYKRNRCLGYTEPPSYMIPAQPGGLLSIMPQRSLPPAEAPNVLTDDDVESPSLPPVVERPPPSSPGGNNTTAPGPSGRNGQPTLVASMIFSSILLLLTALVLC